MPTNFSTNKLQIISNVVSFFVLAPSLAGMVLVGGNECRDPSARATEEAFFGKPPTSRNSVVTLLASIH